MPNRRSQDQPMAQADKFIEAARELGCDESEDAFAEVVRKVASPALKRPLKPAIFLRLSIGRQMRPGENAPHLGDMFAAGLTIQQAAKLDQMIRANPDQPGEFWWQLLAEVTTAAAAEVSPEARAFPSPSRRERMQ
jgi:hypothetical protein